MGTELDENPKGQGRRHPDFALLLDRFHATIDGILAVVDAISEPIAELDRSRTEPLRLKFGPGEEERFQKFLKNWGRQGRKGGATGPSPEGELPETPPSQGEGSSELAEEGRRPDPDPGEPVGARGDLGPTASDSSISRPLEGEDVQRFVEELHKALSTENFAEFGAALHRAEAAPRHSSILHGSLLAMAVSSFETLVAGVATQHYLLHQGAIGTEKEFTLADLQAFASVDDAIDVAIARRVDNLMRGSIDDWSAWFRDLGLPGFEALAADYKRFHETVQRRHLVVHNAGRVSRQYQAKVDDSSTLGEELSIDRDYLERAVDEISVLGNRLLAIAWSKWEPQERSMTADRVKNRSFKLLQDERWLVAEHLAATTAQLAEQDVDRQRAKVNGWIAKLRQQGIDAINDEVVSWDTSALDPIFTVARHALLNEVDELVTVATPLVEDGRLTIRELGTWPLFDLVRGDQRFLALVERAEPDTDQGASGEEQPSGAPGSVDGDRDSPPSHESDPSSQEDQPEK